MRRVSAIPTSSREIDEACRWAGDDAPGLLFDRS